MAGKYGQTPLEGLIENTINISEWTEFKFINLCMYWDNQNDNTEGNICIWIGVSHRLGSALCYWVLTEKGKIIARTTIQPVTKYETENPLIQQIIRNYHLTLESAIAADEFMSDPDGMDAFINKEVPSQ